MKTSFIGIGPGKSGTTWTYLTLQKHPQILMSKVKETNFFNDNFFRGIHWYEGLFDISKSDRLLGEISNTYIFSEEAAERIFEYNSDVKIITILRDPIERAISHYFFLIRNGADFKSFSDAILKRPDLLERGLYSRYLEPYLEKFPREKIFIGVFDDLKSDSQLFANALFEFLELPVISIVSADSEKLKASAPKSRYLAKFVKSVATFVRSAGHPVIVEKVKRLKLLSNLYRSIDYNAIEILQREAPALLEFYSSDVERCSELTGRDLKEIWFAKYKK